MGGQLHSAAESRSVGALDGRVAIVTGAGRGIGREHALLLAAEGASVVVNDLGGGQDGVGSDRSPAAAVAEEIVADGGVAVANSDDIASFRGAQRLVESAVERFGDLHVVVNNAGIVRGGMLASIPEEDFDRVVAVHLKGTFNLCRHAARYWREQSKAGRRCDRSIVNTSSAVGLHGAVGQASYAAAKAGVVALTLVAAAELDRYGARVNCICPAARSRLTLEAPGLRDLVGTDAFDPRRVAPLVAHLASDACDVSGQVFSVVGSDIAIYRGWTLGEEISHEGRWSIGELAAALDRLPRPDGGGGQLEKLAAMAAGSDELPPTGSQQRR